MRAAVVAGAMALLFAGIAKADAEPAWQWSEQTLRERVDAVRAGPDLTPSEWPGGARVAVGISFDVDTEPLWLSFLGEASPSYLSRGEYGARAGLPRILALLDREQIPATFFVPAATLLLHPELAPALSERPQHEIGFHSYIHENPLALSATEERQVYAKAMGVLEKLFGRRPVGFRSAAWDLSDATIDIVREMGFLYDSSMMADDRPYRLLAKREDTGLVELPVEWILDDWPYFGLVWKTHHHGLRPADEVFSIWKGEFDGAYEERGLFILVMHPQVIGHRYRIAMLKRLIQYMKSKPGVWFATHEAIARHVLAAQAPAAP
jgi:peptidoglycan/xylan/chitin deacetylase (PgdA/CDA1 family)